jgi:hypothetical protein
MQKIKWQTEDLKISILTLNVNGLRVLMKRWRSTDYLENMIQLHTVYKKLTSNILTYTN